MQRLYFLLYLIIYFGVNGVYAQSERPDTVINLPAEYLKSRDGRGVTCIISSSYRGVSGNYYLGSEYEKEKKIMFTCALMPQNVVYGCDKIYFFFEKDQMMTITSVSGDPITARPPALSYISVDSLYNCVQELISKYKPLVFKYWLGREQTLTYTPPADFSELLEPLAKIYGENIKISPTGELKQDRYYKNNNFSIVKGKYLLNFYNINEHSLKAFFGVVSTLQEVTIDFSDWFFK